MIHNHRNKIYEFGRWLETALGFFFNVIDFLVSVLNLRGFSSAVLVSLRSK